MDIVGIGNSVIDHILLTEKMPGPNETVIPLQGSWQYGGKAPTALVAAAKLGLQAAIVGTVGGITGQCIRNEYIRQGVDVSHLIDRPGQASQICMCVADRSTNGRTLFLMPAANQVTPVQADELDRAFLLDAKWLIVSKAEPAQNQAAIWFKQTQEGRQVVADADQYSYDMHNNLHLYDHLIMGEAFYRHIFPDNDRYKDTLYQLRMQQDSENAVTMVTLGGRGTCGYDERGNFFTVPAYRVKTVDTTGAGDVFHGAYIAAKHYGMSTVDAVRFASAAAAIKCTRLGGRAALADRRGVFRFMQTGQIDYKTIDQEAKHYEAMPF